MALGVSVVICCYNSAEVLPQTLRHLAQQKVSPGINWEVIVVDNASTDNTFNLATELWDVERAEKVELKVLHQAMPGKNYAFHTAIKNARFEYILTCDDDNWLNPDYIQNAFDLMQADSDIGALGGLGIIEPEEPVLVSEDYIDKITVSRSQHWAATEHWVYGAGSMYRKTILAHLLANNWQQITKGRTGSSLICGEDVEFCFIFHLLGYKIVANDQLTFKHFIPHKKQNIEYLANLQYWLAYSNILLYSYQSIIFKENLDIERVLKGWLFSVSKSIIKQRVILTYQTLKNWQSASIENKLRLRRLSGMFTSLLHNRHKIIKHHHHLKIILANAQNNL